LRIAWEDLWWSRYVCATGFELPIMPTIKQALLIARSSSERYMNDLLENTTSIAFMGTPHLGSNKAAWLRPLTNLSSLLRSTNKRIVAALEPGSEVLVSLQQDFHVMIESRKKNKHKWMNMYCFYEEKDYPGIGKVK